MPGGAKAVAIGIDIGGTAIKLGAVDENGRVLARGRVPVYREIPFQDFLSGLYAAVDDLINQVGRIEAIGIGVPGVPDPATGRLRGRCPALPSLMEGSLSDILAERYGVPAKVRNDAVGATYGEMRHGAGRPFKRFAVFTLGTGIGGAMVIDGKVIDGPDGLSPQFGCMSMDPARTDIANPVPGMLENLASASAVVRRYRALDPDAETPDAKTVCDRAKAGETIAVQVIDETAKWLGQAIGIMSNMLNIEAAIIGGGLSLAGPFLIDQIAHYTYGFVLPLPGRPPKILQAETGNDAGMIGASVLALDLLAEMKRS
ncbi:MAG TPA: ROK family protein [Dongiaceae bacterium]|nr:ROK family protein [Dongiaceae bacterium]